ncbi:hypothetical protein H0H92_013336 [Tricholoma furcatifolium]|nr:hypothetical protein H0H92_013336 [Tricholoma furcatifolium]
MPAAHDDNSLSIPTRATTRQRKLTAKQKQQVLEKTDKANTQKKKAATKALRDRQAAEEANGFTAIEVGDKDQPNSEESEDEYDGNTNVFTSTKIVIPAPRPHRITSPVNSRPPLQDVEPNNGSFCEPERPFRPQLVRRVTGPANSQPPVQDVEPNNDAFCEPERQRLVRRVTGPVNSRLPPQDFYQHEYPSSPELVHRESEDEYDGNTNTFPSTKLVTPAPRPQLVRRVTGPVNTRLPYEPERASRSQQIHSVTRPANGRSQVQAVRDRLYDDPSPHVAEEYSDEELSQYYPSPDSSAAGYAGATIRKDHPVTMSTSTTVVVKKVKVENTGTRGRPRVADYDSMTRAVLEAAIAHFRADVVTREPFLDHAMDSQAAARAWVRACHHHKVQMEFEDEIEKLINSRTSQVRGQLKTVARSLVPVLYGLSDDNTKRENRNLVEDLLDRNTFYYKDPKKRSGFLLHPIFQRILNKTWFKNKADDGVVQPAFSDGGIPLVTIGLIATVVECCLDEWQSGEHGDVPFAAAQYHSKFHKHMKTIQNFADRTHDTDIIFRLRNQMLKMARKHAKVENDRATVGNAELDDADIEAAKEEWKNMVFSDDDN